MMQNLKKPKLKKGQPMLYVALLLLAIMAMAFLRYCNRPMPLMGKSDGALQVAIEYAPLSCYTYEDTLGGYTYDFLRMVAKHAGLEMKFNPMVTLHSSLEEMKNGKYQIVAAEFPVTKENKSEYLFTDALYLDREILVQRKLKDGSVKVKSQLDLAHDTVYVIKSSPMYGRLQNLSREIGDTIYVKTENLYGPEQLFMRVATGEIDYAVVNEKLAQELAPHYPNVSVATAISFTQFQSLILSRRNAALCDSLNKWMKEVRATEEYKLLYNRYFNNAK